MAKYRINGSNYEVAEDIQGDDLTTTLTQLADYTAGQNRTKFLDFLGKSEGAGYDTIVGGRQKVTDFSAHPNIVGLRTADGPSTAAGKYQVTGTTWREMAPQVGATSFSPADQDKVAVGLLKRRGALDDVNAGDFNAAIGKLGKEWASLPSSIYGQAKRTQAWVDQALAQPMAPAAAPASPDAAPTAGGYQPFGAVVKNIDPAKLNKNAEWLAASRQVYAWDNRKQFTGTDDDLAEYGKGIMGYFNSNVVAMTANAAALTGHGTQDDKNAFLHLMDQYDETQWSWEGAGRGLKGMATDPSNLLGLGTLGVATAGKIAASKAAKMALTETLRNSLGRTGIQMGILGGIQGATTDTIKQSVEVTGGRKDSVDLGELAGHTALGAVGGVVLGTTADALLTVAAPAAQKAVSSIAKLIGRKVEPTAKVPAGIPDPLPNAGPISTDAEKAAAMAAGKPLEAPKVDPLATPQVDPHAPPEPHTAAPGATPDATATAPVASLLTQDEIAAATARAQKGRLWVDDMPFTGPLDARHALALVIPEQVGGMRATARVMAQLTDDAGKVAAQLRGLGDSELKQTLEVLRSGSTYTANELPVIARAVQILHDEVRVSEAETLKLINKVPDSPKMQEWLQKLEDLATRKTDIALADDAMGSFGGSLNRQRQEGLAGLQGASVESLMTDKGLDNKQATALWQEMVASSQSSQAAKEIEGRFAVAVQGAFDNNNFQEALRLTVQKRGELNALAEDAAPHGSGFWAGIHYKMGGLRELMISNLFTIKTVMINLIPAAIKTMMLPTVKYLVTNPLEKAAVVELSAHYAAMGGTLRGAMSAAMTAFKYEQSILTKDSGRLMEGEMVMTGRLGGALRFFPRVLNASDEFLGQLNYAGYVSGKAASAAVIEGTEKGMKGDLLNRYVKNAVETAKHTMFETGPEAADAMIQPIVNKGVNLGKTGDELLQYVRAEAMKNPKALRLGSDKVALDFVRDALYKRGFSGGNPGDGAYKSSTSGGAQALEGFLKKTPEFSLLIGQMFFRTPIRVFEEGIRMTPGVQLLAPGFMKDLTGANGVMRQVRAQGESMVGLGLTGAALSLYASGAITGSGVYNNYKQDKTRKDGPAPEPYSIRFKDGSTWSFKNIDPISTPLKILINAFEGFDELKIKEAQEGYVNKDARKLIQARMWVATQAITAAVTDANLVAGLKGTMDLMKELSDPEGDEAAWIKKAGSELGMLVPNTLHKIAQMNDPRMRDPATWFQSIETRLGHNLAGTDEVKTTFAYDALGQVRQQADVGAMWNIFSLSTQEERIRGNTPEHGKLMLEFDRLAQETGAVFSAPPPKHQETGSLDLRTMMTADKQETMYDRWQRNYRDLQPDRILLPIAEAKLPDGTFQYKGAKVSELQSTIKELQDIAFTQLLKEEKIRDRLILEAKQKARAQAGLLDYNNRDK